MDDPRPNPRTAHLLRQALSALLTLVAVAVTLATSPDDQGMGIDGDSLDPIEVSIWQSTTVMGEDESSIHLLLSFPTDLLDTHEHALTLSFEVSADRTEHQVAPQTAWSLRVGDSTADSVAFTTDLKSLSGAVRADGSFFLVWEFVDSFGAAPLPISGDCDEDGCIPCDPDLKRCDVMLTLERNAVTLPRVQIKVDGTMKQLATTGAAAETDPTTGRQRF